MHSSITRKKPFTKNSNFKKSPKIVLVAQETYSSGEESEEEEEETTSGVAAIATTSTSTPSLFESPNENLPNKIIHCLMARGSEVSSYFSSVSKTKNEMHDLASLKAKEEVVALDYYLSNLQGEDKKHFGALASQLNEALDYLEEKGRIEREDSIEIASLNNALEEEQELRVSLEEKLETIEESHDEVVSKLIKECDHALAKKMLKKEKVEFGNGIGNWSY